MYLIISTTFSSVSQSKREKEKENWIHCTNVISISTYGVLFRSIDSVSEKKDAPMINMQIRYKYRFTIAQPLKDTSAYRDAIADSCAISLNNIFLATCVPARARRCCGGRGLVRRDHGTCGDSANATRFSARDSIASSRFSPGLPLRVSVQSADLLAILSLQCYLYVLLSDLITSQKCSRHDRFCSCGLVFSFGGSLMKRGEKRWKKKREKKTVFSNGVIARRRRARATPAPRNNTDTRPIIVIISL